MKHRSVLVALGISLAMVVALATLVPRVYLVNDDLGLSAYLRANTYVPWISPILVRALGFAYQEVPALPWYGLYQYALLVATGAIVIHTCLELVDPRPGTGRMLTMLGAVLLSANHLMLAAALTWTAVAISSTGTAVVAFVAHALRCQASGRPLSWPRTLIYGLVLVGGYMLRPDGLDAALVALAPLVAISAWRFARRRYLPRGIALAAFLAPILIVFATQHHVPVPDQDVGNYAEYVIERGRIHGQMAFNSITTQAPELLESAGWTVEDYIDFQSWMFIDDTTFSLEQVKRLAATGGVPLKIDAQWSYLALQEIYQYTTASVLVLFITVATGLTLAWLGLIERRVGVLFSIGYLVFLIAVSVWMAARFRFPQRVTIAFFAVAALGLYTYLARGISSGQLRASLQPRPQRGLLAGAVLAVLVFGWTRGFVAWLHRDPFPNSQPLQALADRVAQRKGFVFQFIGAGQAHFDPLRAEPRTYYGLEGGWCTFSPSWYRQIAHLGVRHGSEVFGAMVDNPDVYVLAWVGVRDTFEDWIRRKLRRTDVRLALVDAAAIPDDGRPELYRVVTTNMVPGSDEWKAHVRLEAELENLLPGPPEVTGLTFHPIELVAPYEQYRSRLRQPSQGISLSHTDGGLRVEVAGGGRDGCTRLAEGADEAGVHVRVDGLGAARFEVSLIDAENVVGFHVFAQTRSRRSIQWHWELSPDAQKFHPVGTFTLVPGYSAHQLRLGVSSAVPAEVTDLHFIITLKPEAHAGFELRHLELARPSP